MFKLTKTILISIIIISTGSSFAKEKVYDSHYTKAWGESGEHGWKNSAISLAKSKSKNNVRAKCDELTYSDGTKIVRYAKDMEVVTMECSQGNSGNYKCKALARAICYHYE